MENRRIPLPAVEHLLAPMLPSLPAAALSTQPGPGMLRLFSPILRQRVRLFSSSSREPWLRLLCYNTDKAAKLADVARSGDLEPHPVSGEVEVDWDYDVETRFRRLDVETLQALVVLKPLGLVFQLVYCVGDEEGGGDGWRVGEVSVPDKPSPFSIWGGMSSVADAEADFKEKEAAKKAAIAHYSGGDSSVSSNEDRIVDLVHPRPESSASSIGSQMVARLETSAGIKEQTEFGIKQHICRTIRSLFSLSKATGVDRQEFEQLVRRELDILSMMKDEECV